MKFKKSHPMWPEHQDTKCPHCGQGLEEDEYTFDYCDDMAKLDCPSCGGKIRISRKVKVDYLAQKDEDA